MAQPELPAESFAVIAAALKTTAIAAREAEVRALLATAPPQSHLHAVA